MNLKVSFRKNSLFFLLITLVLFSCNEDFNTVGYDLISSSAFETERIDLPVFSYQKEILSQTFSQMV